MENWFISSLIFFIFSLLNYLPLQQPLKSGLLEYTSFLHNTLFLIYLCIWLILEESHTETKGSQVSSPWKRNLPPPFFAGNKKPTGLPGISNGQDTPQTLPPGTKAYYFSLFDPNTNTPFYSAYKVTPDQAVRLGTYSRKDANGNWRDPTRM